MTGFLTHGFNAKRDILLGEPSGRVKLIWYVDYCDHNTRRIRDIMQRCVTRFGVRNAVLAVRFTTLGTDHSGSEIAARAAIAAAAQDRFLDMHNALFSRPSRYSEGSVCAMAEVLELDMARFREDLFSEATTRRIEQDRASSLQSGAYGGALLFIDNRQYAGAWDETSLIEAIEKPIGHVIRLASEDFFHWAASAGLILVLMTVLALIVANVGYFEPYEHLRDTQIGLSFGEHVFSLSLEAWINDGLMALFFLVVGIEIKREMVDGELSDMSRAALPIMGALGGMLVPAAIYYGVNWGLPTQHGWGIPMATDIAFTLGIMALLGDRVPTSLKVFVSALAIADDLGAIVVIAVFYGHGFDLDAVLWALAVFAVMLVMNRSRIYARIPYLLLGVVLWYFVHESGLHATVAGVLTAAAIPSRRGANIQGVAAQTAALFDDEMRDPDEPVSRLSLARLQEAVDRLREPGWHLQHALESWSNFLILPLFAFFNTGILIAGSGFTMMAPEEIGVVAGLVIGKPLGIVVVSWIAVRMGIAKLSAEISWTQMIGAGFLAGVGFTMSIFIGSATFEGAQLGGVKLAILVASVAAASIGVMILMMASRQGKAR